MLPFGGSPTAIVAVTLALGFTAGGLYEVWEWFIHHSLSAPMYVTYDDTVTDMIRRRARITHGRHRAAAVGAPRLGQPSAGRPRRDERSVRRNAAAA